MLLKKVMLITCCFSLLLSSASAQYFNNKHVSSLILEENDSLTFIGDSLIIDTLRMFNYSKLKLTSSTYMVVKNAFLGEEVQISSTGGNGQHGKSVLSDRRNGADGTAGKDILLIISFNQLGSLTISTDGGNGGDGGKGFSPNRRSGFGERGLDAGNGGNGGAGKDAGNLAFYYRYTDFMPIFNREGPHSIHFSLKGGACGKGGSGGKGGAGGPRQIIIDPTTDKRVISISRGRNGDNGLPGGGCHVGVDGQLILKKINKSEY